MKTVYFRRESNGASDTVHCAYDPPRILFYKKPEGLKTEQILEEARAILSGEIPEIVGVTFSDIKVIEYYPTKVKPASKNAQIIRESGIEELVNQ